MNVILDISLGVLVIFLFLSLIVSAIGEAISTWMSLRYQQLRTGIAGLLQGDETQVNEFFDHPLIKALRRGRTGKPSYIHAKTFAQVMLAQVRGAAKLDVAAFLAEKIKNLPAGDLKKTLEDFTKAGVTELSALKDKIKTLPEGEVKKSLTSLTEGWSRDAFSLATQINDLPDGDLKKALQALIADGKHSLEDMEKKLATYYDATMERVTGWFKRRMQIVLFAVGFVVCASLNIDVFVMVPLLHRDAHLRQGLAGVAVQVGSQTNAPTLKELDTRLENIPLPIGWNLASAPTNTAPNQPASLDLRGMPPGIDCCWWLKKLCGLTICALAASFGAPFWFDLLSKVVHIRGSLPIPLASKKKTETPPATEPSK